MTIIVLDGLAFIAFCTAIYLRKTCTPRPQKDTVGAAHRLRVYVRARRHMRRHDRRLAGRRRDRGRPAGERRRSDGGGLPRAALLHARHALHRRRYPAGERAAGPQAVTRQDFHKSVAYDGAGQCRTFDSERRGSIPAVSTRPTRTSATAAALPFSGDACSVGPGAGRRAAEARDARARPRGVNSRSSP